MRPSLAFENWHFYSSLLAELAVAVHSPVTPYAHPLLDCDDPKDPVKVQEARVRTKARIETVKRLEEEMRREVFRSIDTMTEQYRSLDAAAPEGDGQLPVDSNGLDVDDEELPTPNSGIPRR